MTRPITDKVRWMRQRQRTDGTWRVWWEPDAAARRQGFTTLELDAGRPSWSVREAKRRNQEVDHVLAGGHRDPRGGRGGRTIDDLIASYTAHRNFLDRADATQVSYRANLKLISEKWGSYSVADFAKPVVATWYDTLRDTAGDTQAQRLVGMLSILFSFAERIGWRAENSNPCFRLGMVTPKSRPRAPSWNDFDALMHAADDLGLPAIALGIGLAFFTGQRQTDIIAAEAWTFQPAIEHGANVDAWAWNFRRSKRNNPAIVTIHSELAPRLERAIEAADGGPILLQPHDGAPYSGNLFRKHYERVRHHAAQERPSVADLRFRQLRPIFGQLARQGGASRDDTADVLGNSAAINGQLADIYLASQLETAHRAIEAIQRPGTAKRRRLS